jgi:hypothetical protein
MTKKTMKWETVKSGEYPRKRLVEYPSGKIVGCVYSSNGLLYGGYSGMYCGIVVGDYVTESSAMKAVDDAAMKKTGK